MGKIVEGRTLTGEWTLEPDFCVVGSGAGGGVCALKLLNPGGVLVTCTCSYHMTEPLFLEVLTAAAADARRLAELIKSGASSS